MTAAIHGLTLVVAGPATHRRRYVDGRPVWHCSETDGPCQGHGRPRPDPRACPNGHIGEQRPRTDKPNAMVCRGCERDRERARVAEELEDRQARHSTETGHEPLWGRNRSGHRICYECRRLSNAESRRRFNGRLKRPEDMAA